MMRTNVSLGQRAWSGFWIGAGALGLTVVLFLVLPLMQAIQSEREPGLVVREIDAGVLPPPPPPPPEEEPDEPEAEDEPPELEQSVDPLDLSQLELALDPGAGGGWFGGDFALDIGSLVPQGAVGMEEQFVDFDQRARPIYQVAPVISAAMRKKSPGRVVLIFLVDEEGRVREPKVESSTDPVFERAAIAAIKKWKFEPKTRGGRAVSSPSRIPITFPAP